jgi:phosphatidylethanolamine/phosphatidyl-N-methylethanolamine N-methyltransferase
MTAHLDSATATTRARYDRLARRYDAMQSFTERRAFERWRRELWTRIEPGRILEIGVGTGKNVPFYPANAPVTGIDISPQMLLRARSAALDLGREIDLRIGDAQALDFADAAFDTAVSTFVFCSVPDAVKGLAELGRVVKPGGDIWLLEHVRVDKPVIGTLMDILNPLVVPLMGANINRRTVENVRTAGLEIVSLEHPGGALVKLIHARPGRTRATPA